jgi:membrane protein
MKSFRLEVMQISLKENLRSKARRNFSFLYHVILQADRHDCWGMAGEIAFQMMFCGFWAALFSVSILSILGAQPDVFNSIIRFLGSFLPFELYRLIRNQIVEIAQTNPAGIFIFSAFGATWTLNILMNTLKKNFERSYHIKETRPFWRVRMIVFYIAMLATMGISLVLVLLLLGMQIARFLETVFGYATLIAELIRVLRLPVAFIVTALIASLLYWAMINVQEHYWEVLPGAIFFSALWHVLTFGFGHYLKRLPYYNPTYGTLGVFLVLMIWMYLTALSLLIGGEVNAEIHRRKVAAHIAQT